MVDPWTQWLLDPLHQRIFDFLKLVLQDGTHDQIKPIYRLLDWQKSEQLRTGRKPGLFSFDLSAATDRLPLTLQKILLSPFITSWGAEV
jgi:hypothetical protein